MSERRVGAKRPRGFESLPAYQCFRIVRSFQIFGDVVCRRIAPSVAVENGEGQVGFLLRHGMGVDAKGRRRVREDVGP